MNKSLNLLAFTACVLMALGSVPLRFVGRYQSASIAISVAGFALAWFCLRAAKAHRHFILSPFIASRFGLLFTVLGFIAVALPEFLSDSISQWSGPRMLSFVIVDTIVSTAFFVVIWIYVCRPPNESPEG